MLELNGELSKPLDESGAIAAKTSSLGEGAVDGKRLMELGSVKFDSDVSDVVNSSVVTRLIRFCLMLVTYTMIFGRRCTSCVRVVIRFTSYYLLHEPCHSPLTSLKTAYPPNEIIRDLQYSSLETMSSKEQRST